MYQVGVEESTEFLKMRVKFKANMIGISHLATITQSYPQVMFHPPPFIHQKSLIPCLPLRLQQQLAVLSECTADICWRSLGKLYISWFKASSPILPSLDRNLIPEEMGKGFALHQNVSNCWVKEPDNVEPLQKNQHLLTWIAALKINKYINK